jgi:hypothetical protein
MPTFTQPNVTASVNRVTQIGVETTPGTPVAASRRLQSGGFDLTRQTEYTNFRPPGFKFDSASAKLREWASGSFTGGLAYNEFHVLCASALKTPAAAATPAVPAWAQATYYKLGDIIVSATFRHQVTSVLPASSSYPYGGVSQATALTFNVTPGGTTNDGTQLVWTNIGAATTANSVAYEWFFDMNTFGADQVTYFTVERGDRVGAPTRARRASRSRLTGLSVSSSRTGEVEVSADLVASALQVGGFTMASLSDTTMIPATPSHLNVYVDNTPGGLGTTQIQGNFSCDFSLSDRASAFFFHGRQIPGIAGFVETSGMGAEANLTQKDDEWVDDALLQLAAGTQRFIRYEFSGPEIGTTGIRNAVIIDMCAQIGDSETESDEDGVFSIELPYRLQHNGNWTSGGATNGRALQITVRNTDALITT